MLITKLRDSLSRSKMGRAVLQCQIAATDHQIDQLVYELYGLTEEEIGILEGSDD